MEGIWTKSMSLSSLKLASYIFGRVPIMSRNTWSPILSGPPGGGPIIPVSKFSWSINFVIFMKLKLITKILSTEIFSSMGVSTKAAMNHENCCLEEAGSRKF